MIVTIGSVSLSLVPSILLLLSPVAISCGFEPRGISPSAERKDRSVPEAGRAHADSAGKVTWCEAPCESDNILKIRLAKSHFRRNESVPFEIEFKNATRQPIGLASPLTFGWSLFAILRKDGNPIQVRGVLGGLVPANPIFLKPGEKRVLKRDIRKLEGLDFGPLSPGNYSIKVCYVYPVAYGDDPKQSRFATVEWKKAHWPRQLTSCEVKFVIY